MKEAIQKKIEYISEKYIKTVFKCVLKIRSDIWWPSLAHIAEDVPGSSSSLSGLAQAEWSRFPIASFPSNPQEIEDDV